MVTHSKEMEGREGERRGCPSKVRLVWGGVAREGSL